VVLVKIVVFWAVISYSLVERSDVSKDHVASIFRIEIYSSRTGLVILTSCKGGGHETQEEGVKKGTRFEPMERHWTR
jgi:hypothetical protein